MSEPRIDFQMPHFVSGCLLICYMVVVQSATADVTPWVDIEVNNGLLFVATEVAGIHGHALIDTGAQINAINERFLATTGLSFPKGEKVKISGVYGTAYRNSYRKVPVRIFGTELDFADIIEVDLGPPEIQLIIGAGFLQQLIFQFDYPNQRMRAITRDSLDLKKLKNVVSRRDTGGGSPIVKVRLNDEKDVWLVIDTGSNGGVLMERSLASKQGWLDRYPAIDSVTVGVNSSGRMQRFKLPFMTFGGFQIENPIVSVPAEGESIELFKPASLTGSRIPRRRGKAQGLLGYDVLRHFVVTIDYTSGYVHIEPGSSSPEGQ